MKNQNLNIELDLTMLHYAMEQKIVEVNEWNDKDGKPHKSIILFAKQTKNPTNKKTHNLTCKAIGSFNNAKVGDNVVFVGKATPSKYQPEDEDPQPSNTPSNQGGSDNDGVTY